MEKRIINDAFLTPIFETEPSLSEWFGYYNYDPLNVENNRILCNRSPIDKVAPQKGVSIKLGYYDVLSRKWHAIGDTDSWNWQQGAMMQWLPSFKGKESKIIYNFSQDGHLRAKIVDSITGERSIIDWPIYGITPDGKKSIAIDLERSYWCRAYHYQSIANAEKDGLVFESDGIFEIDLENNRKRAIIPISEIISHDSRPYFKDKKHWVEHIMISPSGARFAFLHRFSEPNNVSNYQTRLFIANIDGSGLHVVPDWESYDMSHFGWDSDDAFAVYSYKIDKYWKLPGVREILRAPHINYNQLINRIFLSVVKRIPFNGVRQLFDNHSCYRYYTIDNGGNMVFKEEYSNQLFNIDGHPSFTKDGNYMITDTYPDHESYRNLIIYNTHNGKYVVVARLFAGLKGNPATCDLHPKLSRNNDYVMVDSAFDGSHHLLMYKIDWDNIKKAIN